MLYINIRRNEPTFQIRRIERTVSIHSIGKRGIKGDTGSQGVQGNTGVKGDTGNTGAKGDTGSQGVKGDTGSQGVAGNTGVQGDQGDQGDTGVSDVPGDTGVQGDTGVTGSAGAKGDTGTTGAKGDTGTAGAAGAKGDTGNAGAKGDTGTAGSAGAKGDTGTAGSAGAAGATGVTGATGVKGDTGATQDWGDIGGTLDDQTDLVAELSITSSSVLAYWDGQANPTASGQSYPLATLIGDAAFIDATDGVRLTTATNNEDGAIEWILKQKPFMRAQFRFRAHSGDGADGVWFYCLADGTPGAEYGGVGFDEGYIIYFSEHHNVIGVTWGGFNDGNQTSADPNDPTKPLVVVGGINDIDDGNEHEVDITIRYNRIIVLYDGVEVINYADVYTRDYTNQKLGFGARTGGLNNAHDIHDLVVFKLGGESRQFGLIDDSPQGATGVKGDTGNTGSAGAVGATGAKGDTGNTGSAGAKGDTGNTGSQGVQGDTGSQGVKGDTGNTGSQGVKGDTGSTGSAGAKGDTGNTGSTGAKGDTGNTGSTGAKGDTGTKGDTGSKPAGQLYLSAAGMWPTTTAGCASNAKTELATNDVNIYTLDFDATTQEYAEVSLAMPSDWDGGTVTAVFYWTHPSTTTNFGVVWNIAGRSFANDDALDQAMGTAQQIADTGGTTNDLYITGATPAITITGATASELVQFKVSRVTGDGSDNMAVDAKLLGIMINYTRS